MTELKQALEKHFTEEQTDMIAPLLVSGKKYGDGDALAGAKISGISKEGYDRLNEVFAEAGFDVEFNSRMSFVSFTTSPETFDEELNEAIREL